jgi:radical SAM superfamily enzyme YgiQ (UPF0313 family)
MGVGNMSKIIFLNPSAGKVALFQPWDSKLIRIMTGNSSMYLPPLSAMILAAITPEKHSFLYVDEEIEDIDYDVDVDLVALTAMTMQSCRAYQIAGEFRKRGKAVVIGGIHAAVMTEEAAGHCDALLLGEAENTWPALLEDFEKGALKAVYYAKDYPPVEMLISPKLDIIKHGRYLSFPIQATRGCPYDCDFCAIKHSSGHKYRMKPVQQVVDEICAYEKYNIPGIVGAYKKGYCFVDDNLYVNREYVKELLTALIPLNIRWDGQGTANLAKDDEVLQLMAESGCRTLAIGFESIEPESLKESNKPSVNKVEEYETLISNIAKHGIIPGGYFVFGFDSDDPSIFKRTVDFIKQSQLLQPNVNILTPYPGTRLYDRLHSRIFNTSCLFYNNWSCVFTPEKMTARDLYFGSLWVSRQTTELEFMRKQLKYFWRFGPWEKNPPLKLSERIALIFLSLKLGLHGLGEYQRFLLWAALQRNAADFKTIIWTLWRREISIFVPNDWEPPLA